jgi:hypothetical protein
MPGEPEHQNVLQFILDEADRIYLSRYLWRQPMQRGPLD